MTMQVIDNPNPARVTDDPAEMARSMRAVLGNFCTGVAVITAQTERGPIGMTVQSLVSISMDPPLVMFSPQKASKTWTALREAKEFCANILPEHRPELPVHFAKTPLYERFDTVAWEPGHTGAPVLEECLAFVECSIEQNIDAGDHEIVLGRVVDLGERVAGEPLLFFKGGFGSFTSIPREKK